MCQLFSRLTIIINLLLYLPIATSASSTTTNVNQVTPQFDTFPKDEYEEYLDIIKDINEDDHKDFLADYQNGEHRLCKSIDGTSLIISPSEDND